MVTTPFSDTFTCPWGEAYVAATGTQPAAIYVSNAPGGNIAAGGTIDRISLDVDAQTSFHGNRQRLLQQRRAGSMIYGPSGLTYDPASDTLYVVDTSSASVIAIRRHIERRQRWRGRERTVHRSDDAHPRSDLLRSLDDIGQGHRAWRAVQYPAERRLAQKRRFGGRKRRYRHQHAEQYDELLDRSVSGCCPAASLVKPLAARYRTPGALFGLARRSILRAIKSSTSMTTTRAACCQLAATGGE